MTMQQTSGTSASRPGGPRIKHMAIAYENLDRPTETYAFRPSGIRRSLTLNDASSSSRTVGAEENRHDISIIKGKGRAVLRRKRSQTAGETEGKPSSSWRRQIEIELGEGEAGPSHVARDEGPPSSRSSSFGIGPLVDEDGNIIGEPDKDLKAPSGKSRKIVTMEKFPFKRHSNPAPYDPYLTAGHQQYDSVGDGPRFDPDSPSPPSDDSSSSLPISSPSFMAFSPLDNLQPLVFPPSGAASSPFFGNPSSGRSDLFPSRPKAPTPGIARRASEGANLHALAAQPSGDTAETETTSLFDFVERDARRPITQDESQLSLRFDLISPSPAVEHAFHIMRRGQAAIMSDSEDLSDEDVARRLDQDFMAVAPSPEEKEQERRRSLDSRLGQMRPNSNPFMGPSSAPQPKRVYDDVFLAAPTPPPSPPPAPAPRVLARTAQNHYIRRKKSSVGRHSLDSGLPYFYAAAETAEPPRPRYMQSTFASRMKVAVGRLFDFGRGNEGRNRALRPAWRP